jgi:hypothetical protein
MPLLCLLGGGDGAATASVTSKWAALRHLITEHKYLCGEWMRWGTLQRVQPGWATATGA